MNVNNCDIRFQVDSGAQTSTVQRKYVRKEQVCPSSSALSVYDAAPLKTLGEVDLFVIITNQNLKK